MMLELNGYVEKVFTYAKEKGWWQTYENGEVIMRPSLELRMLMVTEIAEASEEVRSNKPALYWNTPTGMVTWQDTGGGANLKVGNELAKPEGEAVELVDCVIRILDYFGAKKWNIDMHMRDDFHLENRERPLENHMDFVNMISNAHGSSEEKMLGRTVKVIMEYFARKDWDFKVVLEMKMEYNQTRPYRHGGKTA